MLALRGHCNSLVPPSPICRHHAAAGLFPTGHPCARQAQHPVALGVTGWARDGGLQTATLRPGDILFQPALTLHAVEAGGDDPLSISVRTRAPFPPLFIFILGRGGWGGGYFAF